MDFINCDRLLSNRYRRRSFLLGAGLFTSLAITSQWKSALATPRFSSYPFTLGVASGDPLPDSVVLWTWMLCSP
jgi:alkaline phosphatase D